MPTRTTYYVSAPGFVADPKSVDLNTGRQIDWDNVPQMYNNGTAYTITASAAALAGATTIAVNAPPVRVPAGTVLDFTGPGEFALVTATAEAGATALTVEALDAGIELGDTATYIAGGTGRELPAGTMMIQFASGKIAPRDSAARAAETVIGLLATDAVEGEKVAALSGYGVMIGGVFYSNLLPDNGKAGFATWQGEFAGNSTGVVWQTYADNRGA